MLIYFATLLQLGRPMVGGLLNCKLYKNEEIVVYFKASRKHLPGVTDEIQLVF
jgi:hypothetical protein